MFEGKIVKPTYKKLIQLLWMPSPNDHYCWFCCNTCILQCHRLFLLGLQRYTYEGRTSCSIDWQSKVPAHQAYNVLIFIMSFLLPLIAMLSAYILIFLTVSTCYFYFLLPFSSPMFGVLITKIECIYIHLHWVLGDILPLPQDIMHV